ncbi:response regulator [Glaciimonas sp. GG7]
MNKIRVVIADDHPVTLSGVKALVEQCSNMIVSGLALSPNSLFETLGKCECDVLVTDFSMPIENQVDGLEMIRQIRIQFPAIAVVVLTAMKKAPLYSALLALGVRGIVSKDSGNTEITKAIIQAFNGVIFLARSSAELMKMRQFVTAEDIDNKPSLSAREIEILRCLSRGASASEISKLLHRSIKTISHHKRSAMEKLKLETDLQLMRYFAENGLDEHLY